MIAEIGIIICIGMFFLGIYLLRIWILYGGVKGVGSAATIVIVPDKNKESHNQSLNLTSRSDDLSAS